MAVILRLSDAAVLALHAMIHLSRNSGKTLTTRDIASYHGVSENHLAKVMQRLARSGYVESVRGPGGGFRLAKDAGSIRLRELYELFEGPMRLSSCFFASPVCGNGKCVFGDLLDTINGLVERYFEDTTLDDAARKVDG